MGEAHAADQRITVLAAADDRRVSGNMPRRYHGKIIGALHDGEIIRILRVGADRNRKPWAYVACETNGEGWVYREFISSTEHRPEIAPAQWPTASRKRWVAGADTRVQPEGIGHDEQKEATSPPPSVSHL
jgi:hypothetical protein